MGHPANFVIALVSCGVGGEECVAPMALRIFGGDSSQRLRAGLSSDAPPALGKEGLGDGSVFLERWPGEVERADLKDQRYSEECGKGREHRPFGFAQGKQECVCHWAA